MADWSSERIAIDDALSSLGFDYWDAIAREDGEYMTYQRARDLVNVHVGPDGSFAVFDDHDDPIGEGGDVDDLRSVLAERTSNPPALQNKPATRQASNRR
jgi:hypothetical protein